MTFNNRKKILRLQREVVYGPVNSRRLGRSLGINILPPNKKICSFDCSYCQYGNHSPKSNSDLLPSILPPIERIVTEVKNCLSKIDVAPAFITFSGNGEATLHPDFPKIVDKIIQLKNQYFPSAFTTILSNSTEVSRPEIRDSLHRLDHRIMKLDAGDQKILTLYNRPHPKISIDSIVDGLIKMSGVTIQSLWSGGPLGNFNQNNISQWVTIMKEIQPDAVQLYTLDRTPPCSTLLPISRQQLITISNKLNTLRIPSTVF